MNRWNKYLILKSHYKMEYWLIAKNYKTWGHWLGHVWLSHRPPAPTLFSPKMGKLNYKDKDKDKDRDNFADELSHGRNNNLRFKKRFNFINYNYFKMFDNYSWGLRALVVGFRSAVIILCSSLAILLLHLIKVCNLNCTFLCNSLLTIFLV